jgi:hypothetical protein
MNPPIKPPPVISPTFPDETIYTLFAALSLLMGIALIAGGPARISAPAYQMMVQLGGSNTWGAVFLYVGLSILIGIRLWSRWKGLLRWAFLYGAATYLALAIEFVVTAIKFPQSNLTAMIAYGWIALAHVVVSERIRQEAWYWLSLNGRR